MVEQSIFGLTKIDSPLGNWNNSSFSNEDEDLTLAKLYAEARKYQIYRLLKRKLSKKWTIYLRYDGAVSSTAYRSYIVRKREISSTDVRQIKIDSELTLTRAVGDLVFEITNAHNSQYYENLDISAMKGKMSKERYIKKTIRIEMESHYNVMKLCKDMLRTAFKLDDLLLIFKLNQYIWLEFKRTLLPKTDADYIPKDKWLDHLTNVQFEDKSAQDHIRYGKLYDGLRRAGERGGFNKSK